MSHLREKGTKVNPTAHRTKAPSARTGLATLSAFLRAPGAGVPSPRSLARAALGYGLVVIALLLTAAPALGAGAPIFTRPATVFSLHSTRVGVESAPIKINGADVTERYLEYSTSKTLLGEGKGIKVYPCAPAEIPCPQTIPGTPEITGIESQLTHLSPETTYYLSLYAANALGHVTQSLQFITLAPEAPEIGEFQTPEIEGTSGEGRQIGPTYAAFRLAETRGTVAGKRVPAGVEANGSDTGYSFEYSLPEAGHAPAEASLSWQPFASGAVTAAQESAYPTAKLMGLAPATEYYVRLRATNAVGSTAKVEPFQTTPTSPEVSDLKVQDLTPTSASLNASFKTRGFEAHYRFEYATSESGPWAPVPGGEDTVAAPSDIFASEQFFFAAATITGLTPSATYYARIVLDNGNPPPVTFPPTLFQTGGPPSAAFTFPVHAIHGESLRALGAIRTGTEPVNERQAIAIEGAPTGGAFTLGFDGQATTPIAFDARPAAVRSALEVLSTVGAGNLGVSGNPGGPYTIEFGGSLGGSDQPQLTCDASALTPSGACTVTTAQNGISYHNRYFFQYVTQQQFEAGEWAAAQSAPEIDLGGGEGVKVQYVGQDLPELHPGTTYHFRLAVRNDTAPAEPLVFSEEQTLAVPAPAALGAEPPCTNQSLRSGPSAHLPDCRAYELVTPPEKRGALDIDTYTGLAGAYEVGEDGEHFMLHAPGTQWGASPDASESSYFFARSPAGWQMTSATPQPAAGVHSFETTLFNSDLTRVGIEMNFKTSPIEGGPNGPPTVEYATGPPGGSYTTLASVPIKQANNEGDGWAAASADFAKLILSTEDRTLAGPNTGTKSGKDLYELSEGQIRQLNVLGGSPGTKISTCGALMAGGSASGGYRSAPSAISADGSRVFFTDNCTHHLYMRVGGAETVDIGEYGFIAANAEGSKVLLEKLLGDGETREIFFYNTETASLEPLFTATSRSGEIKVSADFSTVYFNSATQIAGTGAPPGGGTYRYDLSTEALRFLMASPAPPVEKGNAKSSSGIPLGTSSMSPNGRYLYFQSSEGVAGFQADPGEGRAGQMYRYDSAEEAVSCVSCASPFDPEPKYGSDSLPGSNGHMGLQASSSRVPGAVVASANGDYLFFETQSALLPADVDGEGPVGDTAQCGEVGGFSQFNYLCSGIGPANDVYEWRANGVHGCSAIQGCLALISAGKGGFKTELLGAAHEGRDVFFATHEALAPADRDTAGDVYDAREGGGFPPPPPPPVECEGDACSTPPSAPTDATPSSLTFQGAGNLAEPFTAPKQNAKPKKTTKHRGKAKPKSRKRSSRKRGKTTNVHGRAKR